VTVDIESGAVTGHMTKRALALVEEWRIMHQGELLEDWALASAKRPLRRIEPLG
jgi:hypothetical protein